MPPHGSPIPYPQPLAGTMVVLLCNSINHSINKICCLAYAPRRSRIATAHDTITWYDNGTHDTISWYDNRTHDTISWYDNRTHDTISWYDNGTHDTIS